MPIPLTEEQITEIWCRRSERAIRWRRADGTLAPGYPTVSLEEETEETLNAMPPAEGERIRRRGKEEYIYVARLSALR